MNGEFILGVVSGLAVGTVTQVIAHLFNVKSNKKQLKRKWCRDVISLSKSIESKARGLDTSEDINGCVRSQSPDQIRSSAAASIISDIEKIRQKQNRMPIDLQDTEVEESLNKLTRQYPKDTTEGYTGRTSVFKKNITNEAKSVTEAVSNEHPDNNSWLLSL